jgi:polar amino acid transport system permease protein
VPSIGWGITWAIASIFAQREFLLEGLLLTLQLSFLAMALGLLVGVTCAALRLYGPRPARALVATYVEVIRNTPLLVQLFLVFFGLPSLGIRLDATTASIIALTVNLGAYATEIVRAGLEAIPRAQIEAGVSLGLSRLQVFRYVVLMPALKVMYPALASQFILLMLATSIVSQISAPDLFHTASIIQSRTFRDFEVYIVVAALYLALALAFRVAFAGLYQLAFARR